ncbi:hypothetical protein [Streptomyces achromogenes]|uniref:hypothetical protein n=1 Tax=Streptomyces achromogenes TaxID=67255 RepID=UPI0033CB30C0
MGEGLPVGDEEDAVVGPVVFVTVDQGTQLLFGQPVVGGVVEGGDVDGAAVPAVPAVLALVVDEVHQVVARPGGR